jgi:hypothetical protein
MTDAELNALELRALKGELTIDDVLALFAEVRRLRGRASSCVSVAESSAFRGERFTLTGAGST